MCTYALKECRYGWFDIIIIIFDIKKKQKPDEYISFQIADTFTNHNKNITGILTHGFKKQL